MVSFRKLQNNIIKCKKCPRLVKYIQELAEKKTRRYQDQSYWGKPLPGFGDINARLLIVGLAPAAHGGNRTGRMFTGDSSGDWLAKVLYENGFANQPTSTDRKDGFTLFNTYITATIRCAPPQNKPTTNEINNCLPYLEIELKLLKKLKVVVCLGNIAFKSLCKTMGLKGKKFGHGKIFHHGYFWIICSYHPSRQNTQTKKLSWKKWNSIFRLARKILSEDNS